MKKIIFLLKALLKGVFINDYKNLNLDQSSWLGKGVSLYIPKSQFVNDGEISLLKHVRIGSYSELSTSPGGVIKIKDHSTLNTNCKVLGDVTIERYCVISANVFISSGNHYAFKYPPVLIRKQDMKVFSTKEGQQNHSKKIVINEDVWVGFGVFIAQGITIGRGAIIGANSVVLCNIPPYTVYAGSPAKLIKKRLNYVPPMKLDSNKTSDWPYFYLGFDHFQIEENNGLGFNLIDDAEIHLNSSISKIVIKGNCNEKLVFKIKIKIGDLIIEESIQGKFELIYNDFNCNADDDYLPIEIKLLNNTYSKMNLFINTIN